MTTPLTNTEQELQNEMKKLEAARIARERRWTKVRLLWNERRFLVRVFIGGLLVSLLIAFLIPVRYQSTAQLMPPEQGSTGLQSLMGLMSVAGPGGDSSSGGGGGGLGSIAGQLLGARDTGQLFLGVLSSRTLEDRLIDQFDLKKVYHDKTYKEARLDLEKYTVASEDPKSGIISIAVEDSDRKRATAIASAYVAELNLLMSQLNTTSGHRERVFLEGRLTEVKQALESAEQDFSQYASKSGAIDITEQGKALVQGAAYLQGQYIAAQAELEGLRQIYTDNNVRVRSAQANVDELRRQLEKLGGKAPAAGTVSTVTPGDGSAFPSIRDLPLLGVPYADLLRRLKVQETVFEVLTQQYELAKVQEAGEAPSVTVLDQPILPEKREFPPRTRITIIGAFVALLLGIAFLFARERWNATDPQDPGKSLVQEVAVTLATSAREARSGKGLFSRFTRRRSEAESEHDPPAADDSKSA